MNFKHIFKNISILMTGTIIAQLIPIVMSPLLTRVYSPSEFGMLAVFMSVASILSVFANFRLDAAIISAVNKNERLMLRNLSVFLTATFTIIIYFVLILFADFFKEIFTGIKYNLIFIFIPIYILLFGTMQLFTYISNSEGQFKEIAKSKIDKNLSMTTIQLVLGIFKTGIIGLVIGTVVSLIVPIWRLGKGQFKKNCNIKFKKKEYLETINKYKRFPLISTGTAAMDKIATESPVIIMNRFLDQSTIGFFDLARRTISQPLSFISASISQVYLKQIAEEKDYKKNFKLTLLILIGLTTVAIFVASIFILWGETIFAFVFGEEWRIVGEYSKILVFPFLIRFIISPLSVVFLKPENIILGGVWQLMYLITSLTVAILFLPMGIETYITAFSISEICVYIIYLVMIFVSLKRN